LNSFTPNAGTQEARIIACAFISIFAIPFCQGLMLYLTFDTEIFGAGVLVV
jgi:hypothetical protein